MTDRLIESLVEDGSISATEGETFDADLSFGDQGHWTDADTLRLRDGSKVRLTGFDAKEVSKLRQNEQGELITEAGDRGGIEQTKAASDLARNNGFSRLVDTGETDPFGRRIMDLQNDAGTSFGSFLTETGVVKANQYTTEENLENQAFNKLWRSATEARGEETAEWHQAADWIQEFISEDAPSLKKIAYDEAELGAAKAGGLDKYYIQDDVQVRSRDRNYLNKAYNPWSQSFDVGLKGVVEGGYGALELIGNQIGWEGLEDYGEAMKERTQYEIGQAPSVITDYKEVEDTGDFVEYIGNLAAMSLPYMALTVGSAVVLPGALAVAAPAAVYSGQIWNEMGDTDDVEKNAGLAIAGGISMAVLDRLGIQAIANNSLRSSAGRQKIIEQLVQNGATRQAAEQQLMNATRLEAAKLSGDAVKFAKDRLKKREVLRNLIKQAGIGTAGEGLTEIGQEAIAYSAAVAGSDKEFDEDELMDRLTNAAIGGGLLGGAFSVPGAAYNTGAWADIAYRLAPADNKIRSLQNQWAATEVEKEGRLLNHNEILERSNRKANADFSKGAPATSINERADRDKARKNERSWGQATSEMFESIPGLWRGATRHIFTDKLQERSRTARRLASLYGGQLNQMYGGATFENSKHLKLAEYKNLMDIPYKTLQSFGFTNTNKASIKGMSDIMYRAYAITKGDWDKLRGTDLEQHIDAIKNFDKQARRMSDKIYEDQAQYNPELGYTADYAYKRRSVDKDKIAKDPRGFEQDLISRFNLKESEAAELTRNILNVDSVTDIDEAFTLTEKGGLTPSSHKERSLGLSEDPEFAGKWLSNNIMNNLSDMAKSAARYTTYEKYLGKDNRVINEMIGEMEQELIDSGMDEADAQKAADKAARGMRDYFDAESGNYNRPTTPFGQTMQDIQKNFLFITTISSLPLATLSSLVELALTTKSLNQGQIKELSGMAKDEAKAMIKNFRHDKADETAGRQQLRDLGFFEWEVGAATVTGATEAYSPRKAEWIDAFFKVIGLKQWTDFTRALRGSMAGDYFMDKLDIVTRADMDNLTNEEVEAIDALRNLGVNVQDAVRINNKTEPLTEAETKQQEEMMRNATFNFINDAVVLPQAALRPLFYQDPRLALFTQFHGFISTFQANHLPKLYRQAFKGQTPSMKYNAFAVITTMIMLGFLSQYLKDLLKYGEDARKSDIAGQLETGQWVQRGINSSGLLGTGERALNLIHPVYETRSRGTADWLWSTAVGESAAASKATTLFGGATDALEGEGVKATEKLLKGTPLGPFTAARKASADWLFGEE